MAGLASARREGKDAFLDALSNLEELRRPSDASPSPGGDGFLPEMGDQDDEDSDEDDRAEMMAFLEASDSEQENEALREIEALRNVESSTAERTEKVLTQYRRQGQLKDALAHNHVLKGSEHLRRNYADRVAAAEDAQSALRIEEDKLRALKKDAQNGLLKDPARIGFHEREVAKAWARLTELEKQRDLAELELHNKTASVEASAHEVRRDKQRDVTMSHGRQADEVHRAKAQIARHHERVAAAEEIVKAEQAEADRREAEGARNNALGKQRLRQIQGQDRATLQEAEEVREAQHARDAKRVLDLKASINRVNAGIRAQNEKSRKKAERTRSEQARRKQDLLNDGHNPYEVFRREEIKVDKEKQEKDMEAKKELRANKLLTQLMEEDRRYRKKVKEDKEQRRQMDVFQKEVGNYAREKRIAAYIRKVTIGSVDVLDPTGTALRLDPSKVTVQKTHAFGLGGARMEEVEKVDKAVEQANRQIAKWKPPEESDLVLPSPQALNARDSLGSRLSMEDDESPKLWVPKLTKLEEQYLAAARERQKQNIVTVQRCWGKEFQGDAFLAKPSVINFIDFEVGKRYKQVVEVTNVSLTFNQFKLLPLDDKIKDFFEIEFVPPGRMSAGVTRYITIWFQPKVWSDISTTFPILAQTGRIDFPLRCVTKKTILTITPQDADATPTVDFGQVLDGESGKCALRVKNDGALATKFSFEPVEPESPFWSMLSLEPESGTFSELATSVVKFAFRPALGATGSFATELRLLMSNGALGDAKFSEEKRVLIRGRCVDTPIYVEKPEYDLKICLYSHIIRENIVLHNRQSVAMKVHVEEPPFLEGELSVNPTLAYVQGHKSQSIQVKFSPKENFLQKYNQFRDPTRPDQEGAFRIPMRVVGADQVLPICTALVGTLTVSEVTLEPSVLAFGTCFVGASALQTLRIINHSLLPQCFAFVKLPSCLVVKDMPSDVIDEEQNDQMGWAEGTVVLDGGSKGTFGTVLPKEVRHVNVIYSPDSATELNQSLEFKVITGGLAAKAYSVPCRGQGCPPPVTLSHTQIKMCVVPTGVVCKESIEVTNTTSMPQTMNLLLPPFEVSGLTASPVCYTLQPKERARLQIDFKATSAYVDLLEPPPADEGDQDAEERAAPPVAEASSGDPEAEDAAAAEAAAAAEEAEKQRAEEHRRRMLQQIRKSAGRRWEVAASGGRSIHSSWKLPICIQQKAEGKATQGKATKQLSLPTMLFVGLDTCVVPTRVAIEPQVLDFGEVTAQQRSVMPITLTPHNSEVLNSGLHIGPLPETSCFKVLNAARPLRGSLFQLMVEFNPKEAQIYESTLNLYSIHHRGESGGLQGPLGQVPLRGKGVRPVLKISPENGILQLGSIVHTKDSDNYVTAQLMVVNDSPFELNYKLEPSIESGKDGRKARPFTLTPMSGTVKGNEQKPVTVTFRPHQPGALFHEKVLVSVPNQKAPTYVYLFGHCFTYQVYAMYDVDFSPRNSVFSTKVEPKESAFKGVAAVGTGSTTDDGGNFTFQSAQEKNFHLQFEKGERVKCLLVGSCMPPGTPKAPQNTPAQTFEFQIEQSEFSSLFTVEAPEGGGKADKQVKGQVQAGKPPIRVAFRYNPPAETALSCGGLTLDLLDGVGQWITVRVRGVLGGGYVPPPNPPNSNQELVIELKAYLQQI